MRAPDTSRSLAEPVAALIEHYGRRLRDYQDALYARQYLRLMRRVLAAERACIPKAGTLRFTRAAAVGLYLLMVQRDEYELARLLHLRDPGSIRYALLARLKVLRGTAFDVFGYTAERRAHRDALECYKAMLAAVAARLSDPNHAQAVSLAELAHSVRGKGMAKLKSASHASSAWAAACRE